MTDQLDNKQYIQRFIQKIEELGRPDLNSVVVIGKQIVAETEFPDFVDKIVPMAVESAALIWLGSELNVDPSSLLEDRPETGIPDFAEDLLRKFHIKKFCEILIGRAMFNNNNNSNQDVQYATKSVPELLDATINPGSPQGESEVLFFDLLRVYMFGGSDHGKPRAVNLGKDHEFSEAGLEGAITNRGKRTISDVLNRASFTFQRTPLAGNVHVALLGLTGMAMTSASTPIAVPSPRAESSAVDGIDTAAKNITQTASGVLGQTVDNNIDTGALETGRAVQRVAETMRGRVAKAKPPKKGGTRRRKRRQSKRRVRSTFDRRGPKSHHAR